MLLWGQGPAASCPIPSGRDILLSPPLSRILSGPLPTEGPDPLAWGCSGSRRLPRFPVGGERPAPLHGRPHPCHRGWPGPEAPGLPGAEPGTDLCLRETRFPSPFCLLGTAVPSPGEPDRVLECPQHPMTLDSTFFLVTYWCHQPSHCGPQASPQGRAPPRLVSCQTAWAPGLCSVPRMPEGARIES